MPATRFLAYSQLLSALLLVAGSIHDPSASRSGFQLSFFIVPVLFAAFCTLAGITLLMHEPIALYLTLLVQGIQVLNLGAPVRLVFTAGLKASTILSSNGLQLSLGAGGEAAATLSPSDASLQGMGVAFAGNLGWQLDPGAPWLWSLSINWVPLCFAYYVWRHSDAIVAEWALARSSASAV